MIELCQRCSESECCHEHGGTGCKSCESTRWWGIHELDLIEVLPGLVIFLFWTPVWVVRDFVLRVQSVSSKLKFVSFNIEWSLGWTLDRNIAHVVVLGWVNYDPSASFILNLVDCALWLALLKKASITNSIVFATRIDPFTSETTKKSVTLIQSWFHSLLIGLRKILVKDCGWLKDSISGLTSKWSDFVANHHISAFDSILETVLVGLLDLSHACNNPDQ